MEVQFVIFNCALNYTTFNINRHEHELLDILALFARVICSLLQVWLLFRPIAKLNCQYRFLLMSDTLYILCKLICVDEDDLASLVSIDNVLWPSWIHINTSDRVINKVLTVFLVDTEWLLCF